VSTLSETGVSYGGYFDTNSVGGLGVYGESSAVSGAGVGVRGTTASTEANTIGVEGLAPSAAATNYGVKGTSHSSDPYAAGGAGFVDQGDSNGVLGQTDSAVDFTAGVWGRAMGTVNLNFGVYGSSVSTLPTAAGVGAQGFGTAGPGVPNAAALEIRNGAITVVGPTKPANKITVAGWTCFSAWDDGPDCNTLAYGRAPIGAFSNAVITNNLIRVDSLIYLTVRGGPPSPGTSCYAQVLTQAPGTATVRVTALGGPTCLPCAYSGAVDVNYLIINPQ